MRAKFLFLLEATVFCRFRPKMRKKHRLPTFTKLSKNMVRKKRLLNCIHISDSTNMQCWKIVRNQKNAFCLIFSLNKKMRFSKMRVQTIFYGDIPLHSPCIGLIRFLKWPLQVSIWSGTIYSFSGPSNEANE